MKKFILLMVLLFPLIGFSAGTTKDSSSNSDLPLAHSVVWEVTGPNIEQPSYLVGTMHMMCGKDFSIDSRIHQALDLSEQLYLEVDLDDPEVQKHMMNAMVAKDSLKTRFSAQQYAQFAEFLEQHSQYKIEMFDQVEYIGIMAALTMESLTCPEIKMLDRELMVLAQKLEMPIYGLETVAEQMKVFAIMNPKKGQLMTEEELTMLIELEQNITDMTEAYQQEDILTMLRLMSDYPGSTENWDEVERVALNNRNKNWVAKMPGIAQEKATVFAFGAGHLAGKKGVIQLLRDAGLTVKPIMK